MKKVVSITAIILFFLISLFLIFDKKEEVKKEIEDLNFQPSAKDNSKKEDVLGLFDKKLEIKDTRDEILENTNIKENILDGKETTEGGNQDEKKDKNKENDEEEDTTNPTPTPTPTVTPTPEPTIEITPTTNTEKEETLEEKTDFISKSLQDETFAEKEIIDATFLPDLVNLFGEVELSKVFVGVEKIEFSNFSQNGNEGKADAIVKTAEGEKAYNCYFYKIEGKWYLYKTE